MAAKVGFLRSSEGGLDSQVPGPVQMPVTILSQGLKPALLSELLMELG